MIVDCSSGTYIRAIARDLGEALGVGGHLTSLRRSRIGSFDVKNAIQLEGFEESLPILKSVEAVKSVLPTLEINSEETLAIRQGKRIAHHLDEITALTCQGVLVAVAESAGNQSVKSLVVFNDGEVNA